MLTEPSEYPYTAGVSYEPVALRPARWVVLGAGGHARSVRDVLMRLNDDVVAISGQPSGGWSSSLSIVSSDVEAVEFARTEGCSLALGVGENSLRRRVHRRLLDPELQSIVAQTATVSVDADLGPGTVVLEHAHVGPSSRLGAGVIVNTGAVVEHDCRVGDFAHVAPRAVVLGGVTVGSGTLVGAGAVVLPGIEVGEECVIGAGAVVTTNIESGVTVTGVPAKPAAEGQP